MPQPIRTVTLVLSLLPFVGVNRRLILALSLRPWRLARKAASPFVRVSFTVTVPALPALALARDSPDPVATSLPAAGTLTPIVAVPPLTPFGPEVMSKLEDGSTAALPDQGVNDAWVV